MMEMIVRYVGTAVGVLILVGCVILYRINARDLKGRKS